MKKYHLLLIVLFFSSLHASASNIGAELPLYSILPFCGLLLSIAIIPLIKPIYWHNNYGKITALWAFLFIVPFALWKGISICFHELIHVALLEYMPFILILFALYTISGGIMIEGKFSGTPAMNTGMIMIGTILASWMGTTGAAMLLIRPIIRANKWRKHSVHTVVFFIFLVANIGGALTPLGDPPLFLGFLQGVKFFWPTKMLLLPMILVSIILLMIYYFIDSFYYKKEKSIQRIRMEKNEPFAIDGKINIVLLFFVIAAVLMSGVWNSTFQLLFMGVNCELQNIVRDFILLSLGLISLKVTKNNIRIKNGFTWFPILEVSKLFAGIFITIIPAISILKAGHDGALYSLLELVNDGNGKPMNFMYFWLTGILSGFLDNAPTYLVFFNIAGSSADDGMIIADYLMYNAPTTLVAISLGAVFMGAMTYIGNAPNFMVRSIAEENNIKMPSFFGYMLWSIIILIPIFLFISFLIF